MRWYGFSMTKGPFPFRRILLSQVSALGFIAAQSVYAVDYFVDSGVGSDTRSGISESQAWASLAKVNSMVFQPGDRILFRKNGVWKGPLAPQGSGTEHHPIQIDCYGIGALPKIDGKGDCYTFLLKNQEFWEIQNLEIVNFSAREGDRVGVLILGEGGPEVLRHIYLRGLVIRNVRGILGTDSEARTTGGIGFEIRGTQAPMRFDDLLVKDCQLANVDSCGVYTWSDSRTHPRSKKWDRFKFTRTIIQNNKFENIGKNAVVIRCAEAPLVAGNLVGGAAARIHGNALYFFGCRNGIMQNNEVWGTRYHGLEGAALDSDYKCEGTIIQYNYSHENGGGLVNFCCNPRAKEGTAYNEGTIVRYNISQNDVYRVFGFDGTVTRTEIYHNTVYIGAGLSPKIFDIDRFGNSEGYASGIWFKNNIIYNSGKGTYATGRGSEVLFENNCFFGYHPKEEPDDLKKIKKDPKFSSSPRAPTPGIPPDYFHLASNSPCLQAGTPIDRNGNKDFWGEPISLKTPSVGASER